MERYKLVRTLAAIAMLLALVLPVAPAAAEAIGPSAVSSGYVLMQSTTDLGQSSLTQSATTVDLAEGTVHQTTRADDQVVASFVDTPTINELTQGAVYYTQGVHESQVHAAPGAPTATNSIVSTVNSSRTNVRTTTATAANALPSVYIRYFGQVLTCGSCFMIPATGTWIDPVGTSPASALGFYNSLAATVGVNASPLADLEGRITNTVNYGFIPASPRVSGHQSSVSTTPTNTGAPMISTVPADTPANISFAVLPASTPTNAPNYGAEAMSGVNNTVMTTNRALGAMGQYTPVATISGATRVSWTATAFQLTRAVNTTTTPVEPTLSITANSGGATGYTLVSALVDTSPDGQPIG